MSELNEKQPCDSTEANSGAGVDCRPMSGSLDSTPETASMRRVCNDPNMPKYVVSADFAEKLEQDRDRYLRHREEGKVNGHRVAVQRDKLQDAIREMVAAKGRYNTQKAMEHLISLLPENV